MGVNVGNLLKTFLEVGQLVEFFRSHDKQTKLTGSIVKIHDGPEDIVDVKSDAANGSVSRVETVHAADVRALSKPNAPAPPVKTEDGPTEQEKEAQAFVQESGYSAENAAAIVKEYGAETILKDKQARAARRADELPKTTAPTPPAKETQTNGEKESAQAPKGERAVPEEEKKQDETPQSPA